MYVQIGNSSSVPPGSETTREGAALALGLDGPPSAIAGSGWPPANVREMELVLEGQPEVKARSGIIPGSDATMTKAQGWRAWRGHLLPMQGRHFVLVAT